MHEIDAEYAYLFRHALLRSAAYELQLPSERARLHRLALEIIEDQFVDESVLASIASELAAHAELAALDTTLQPAQAASVHASMVRYLLIAARHANNNHQLNEATNLYERLAQALPPGPGRIDAEIEIGSLHSHMGRHKQSQEVLQTARENALAIGEAALAERAAVGLLGALQASHDHAAVDALMPELRQICESGAEAFTRASALRALGVVMQDRAETQAGLKLHLQAAAIHRELGHPRALTRALTGLAINQTQAGDVDGAAASLDEAIAVARTSGDAWVIGGCLSIIAYHRRVIGRLAEAAPIYAEAADMLRRCGNQHELAWALCDAGGLHHQMGLLKEADQLYRDALVLFDEVNSRNGWTVASGNLALCCVERGLFEQAHALYRPLVEFCREGAKYRLGETLTNLAILESDSGELDKSLSTTNRALELCQGGSNPMFAACNTGNRARLHFLVGQLEDARRDFIEAIDQFARLKFPYFEGCYRAEYGNFMIATNDPAAATELRAAATLMDAVGNRREWAGRLAPALARQHLLVGEFDAAVSVLNAAAEILEAAGILPAAYSRRSIDEARASVALAAAGKGDQLFRGFRPDWFEPRLRKSLLLTAAPGEPVPAEMHA